MDQTLLNRIRSVETGLGRQLDAWIEERKGGGQAICVAACGLLKAGKSTLLNMLTGHLETEMFKSGPVRETVRNQEFAIGPIVYLDTPGIDAKTADDDAALDGVAKADVLLMVHHPQGELQLQELEFLGQLASVSGDKLAKRLVLVLTHAEAYKPVRDELEAKMLSQCKGVLGFEPACFWVSNTGFKKGELEKKDRLREASNIPLLQAHIDAVYQHLGATFQAARLARLAKNHQRVFAGIEDAMARRRTEIDELRAPHLRALATFGKRTERLQGDLARQLKAYDDL